MWIFLEEISWHPGVSTEHQLIWTCSLFCDEAILCYLGLQNTINEFFSGCGSTLIYDLFKDPRKPLTVSLYLS